MKYVQNEKSKIKQASFFFVIVSLEIEDSAQICSEVEFTLVLRLERHANASWTSTIQPSAE